MALGAVYLIWGSTYLAIRVMVETMPALLAAGVRFAVAGAAFYLVLRVRRGAQAVRFTRSELLASAAVGILLPFGGNGLVTIAEQHVPSGLAALIIASVPLWVVLYRRIAGERIAAGTLAGVAVGFAGVALAFGLTVLTAAYAVGYVSGGHFNPAVSVGLWAAGRFPARHLLPYVVAQVGGAIQHGIGDRQNEILRTKRVEPR